MWQRVPLLSAIVVSWLGDFGGVDVPVQCAMVGGGEGDGRRTLGSKLIASTLSNSFLKFIVPRTKKKTCFFLKYS